MITELLKLLYVIVAIFGWIFFILTIIILIRWNRFINRNPNFQDILKQILFRTIFLDD